MDNFPRLFSEKGVMFKLSVIFFSVILMLFFYLASTVLLQQMAGSAYFIYVIQAVMALMVFLVPALLCSFLFYSHGSGMFSYLSQSRLPSVAMLGLGVIAMFFSIPLSSELGELNKLFYPEDEAQQHFIVGLLTSGGFGFLIIRLVVMALIPALTEEMFFRGLLQNTLSRYVNPYVSMTFVAFVFAVSHADFSGVLPRFIMGAFLGYLLIRSGSLWLSVICHFINNAVIVVAYYFFYDYELEECTFENAMLHNIPLLGVSLIVFAGAVYFIHKQARD